MSLDKPANANYAATVVLVPPTIRLEGLDNLIGVPVLGHQALTQNTTNTGDLRVAFTAETQLSEEYARENDLHRDPELNKSDEKGYLERNRRVRAIKMRGHVSNALLMPLESFAYTGYDVSTLRPGDTFDTLNGRKVCQKYIVAAKVGGQGGPRKSKVDKAFKRVEDKLFPEHLETDQYWRNQHLVDSNRDVVVTQKLHGTSFRIGRVPVLRQLPWYERVLQRLGVKIPEYEHDIVFGSRRQIKDPKVEQAHYFDSDIWTQYGQRIVDLIPEGYMVYGELIGWTPDGGAIQKGYTYHLPQGEMELYVYRVAHINGQGVLADLSWDGVMEFCRARGLKWTPELDRFVGPSLEDFLGCAKDTVFHQDWLKGELFSEEPLPLSNPKSVDEGVCLRQEGVVPTILKVKFPKFLEHETKLLDKDEADMESVA